MIINCKKKTTRQLRAEREPYREDLVSKRVPIYVVATGLRSLDNVGLIFRLCELTRIKKLFLCGITGYPKGQKNDRRPFWEIERAARRIKKTSIYAVPYVPWEYHSHALTVINKLKKEGVRIVVLEQAFGSRNFGEADYKLPLALVVGHELQGVSQRIINSADQVIEIPTYGIGNSLNVAIATGIALYKIIEKTKPFGSAQITHSGSRTVYSSLY